MTIVDDDDGGMLMFELPTKEVRNDNATVLLCQKVEVGQTCTYTVTHSEI